MIKKKDIYDRIVHELSIYVNDIESRLESFPRRFQQRKQ